MMWASCVRTHLPAAPADRHHLLQRLGPDAMVWDVVTPGSTNLTIGWDGCTPI
jgi:hypothetical protein